MYCVTSEYAQKHFTEIMERAKHEPEGVLIVEENKTFVLIDKDELESWQETKELLKDSTILSDVKEAKKEYEKGETLTMEDIFGVDNSA
jgi:prevent-host-death family protein